MQFWAYLVGSVRLRLSGPMPERFVNLCLAHRFPLWNVTWCDEHVYCTLPLPYFFKIRSLARRSGCKVRVTARQGLPFLWRRVKRRRSLLLGGIAVLTALYVLSSCVWFFEVRGNEQLTDQAILDQAQRAGLRAGAWRPAINRDAVIREMLLGLPALAWVDIEFVGTKAIIEVVEKTLPPDLSQSGPGDLIARRAGVIEDILVIQGESVVEAGDVVLAGEVLIEGRITAPLFPTSPSDAAGAGDGGVQETPVRARGQVLARTWYDGSLELSLVESIPVRTGRKVMQRRLLVAGKEIIIYGPRTVPYRYYEERRRVIDLLSWSGVPITAQLVISVYEENELKERRLDRAYARRELERRLKSMIMEEIPPEAQIISIDASPIEEAENSLAMRMIIEVVEDIAEFRARQDETGVQKSG